MEDIDEITKALEGVELTPDYIKPVKKSKYVYICPLCSKEWNQKHKLKKHLSGKTTCHERRTIEFLKKDLQDGNYSQYLDEFNEYFDEIEDFKTNIKNIDEIKELRNKIKRLERNLKRFRENTRILAIDNENINFEAIESELKIYTDRFDSLKNKYLLLFL